MSSEVPAVCFVSLRVVRVSLFTFLLPVCMHVSLAPLSFPLTLLTVSLCFIRYPFPCDSPCVSSRLPLLFHRLPVYPWCHVKPVSLTSASLCFLFYFDSLSFHVQCVQLASSCLVIMFIGLSCVLRVFPFPSSPSSVFMCSAVFQSFMFILCLCFVQRWSDLPRPLFCLSATPHFSLTSSYVPCFVLSAFGSSVAHSLHPLTVTLIFPHKRIHEDWIC